MKTTKIILFLFLIVPLLASQNHSSVFVLHYHYIIPKKTKQQLEENIRKVKEIIPEGDVRDKVIAMRIADNKAITFEKKLVIKDKVALYLNETMKNYPLKMGEFNVFFDREEQSYLAQSYIFNKPFVVEKEIIPLVWSYTNESRQIGAFKAKKAVAKRDSTFFAEVWYTEELPAFPIENLYGIKGGVVEATFAKGEQLKLKSFSTTLSKEDVIEKPSKGKKISEKEFKILDAEKTKKVNENARNNYKN